MLLSLFASEKDTITTATATAATSKSVPVESDQYWQLRFVL